MKLKTYILLLAIFVLSPAALYFGHRAYRDYQTKQNFQALFKEARELRAKQEKYLAIQEKEMFERYAMLKMDTYGGKTPNETLAMFVDALKKRDYKLAAKYYLPWEQKEAEEDLKDWMSNKKAFNKFLEAYEDDDLEVNVNKVGTSLILIYFDRKKPPYAVSLQKNEVNNIWKIEKF